MQKLKALKALLLETKNIIITTHHKPDADALGSSLGLAGFLKKLNHQVKVISPTDFPGFLNWMQGSEEVIIYGESSEKECENLVNQADIIFCLDFPLLSRINELGVFVKNAKAVKVLVDHHLDPGDFADIVFSDTKAPATAVLIYELIEMLEETKHIDQQMADCLYAGVMTDTGSFKHSNTTHRAFYVALRLLDHGADANRVARLIYDNNSLGKLRFLGFALTEKLVYLEAFKTAYFFIEYAELQKFNLKTGDTEGLVNFALSLKGVVFAAVIIDRKEMVKLSFRSVGNFPANEFAKAHFEGGGHKNAAGGKSHLNLRETVDKFVTTLSYYKEHLINTH